MPLSILGASSRQCDFIMNNEVGRCYLQKTLIKLCDFLNSNFRLRPRVTVFMFLGKPILIFRTISAVVDNE